MIIKAKTLQDLFRRYRRPGDLVFAFLFLGFSLFLVYSLPDQTKWAGSGSIFAKPAFYVYGSVYLMAGFSLLHLVSSFLSEPLEGRWKEVLVWIKSVEYVCWFLLYVLIVPYLGYLISTIAFTVTLSLRLGYRSKRSIATTVLFAVVVVVLFKSLLQVKVPGGMIYEYLPTALRSFMLTYF